MDLITIVPDFNPDIDAALDALGPYIRSHAVLSVRPAVAMGEGLEASVRHAQRGEVVAALNAAGFRIVEGGQP